MEGIGELDVEDFEDRTKGDKKAFVRFFLQPVKDEAASVKEGRPIYTDKEYCEIIVPGNKTNIPIKPVNSIIKQRYALQYAQWKQNNTEEYMEGTHLTEVPWLNRSQVEELAYLRIRTLEQLAETNDDVCGRVPGLLDLKRKANLVLERAKDDSVLIKLQEELKERDNTIETMQNQMNDLVERLKALEEDD